MLDWQYLTIDHALERAIRHEEHGQHAQAEQIYRQVLQLQPNHVGALAMLAMLVRPAHPQQAIALLNKAIQANPQIPGLYLNLGLCLRDAGQVEQAIAAYRKAIALDPRFAPAYNNLAMILREQAAHHEAVALLRTAVDLAPSYSSIHSNLLWALHYHPDLGHEEILAEHRRWAQRHALPLMRHLRPHGNDPDPDRPLRLGYVSPDFREHVVGRHIELVLSHHDRAQFQLFCYSDSTLSDPLAVRCQAVAHQWRPIAGLPDDRVADRVRADQIDILVDLNQHIVERIDNRMLLFARKPAPVQVAHMGYPATTGLPAMDYRVTDPHLDPPGLSESHSTEQLIRLPHSFWCFTPTPDQPPVNPLPALAAGHVTFGSLNHALKITAPTIQLWCRILKALPDARLLLLASAIPGSVELLCRHFIAAGIAADRLEVLPRLPRQQYLQHFHRIDITLDPFPYPGHFSSCDSLWMGVPVITLPGRTTVSRGGGSLLANLGLSDLVAHSPEHYVQIAQALAADWPRLQELRLGLRQRLRQSPLTDAPAYTRHLEQAYRAIWRAWCARPTRL